MGLFDEDVAVADWPMSKPCPTCGPGLGIRKRVNQQDTVRCGKCNQLVYNASRVETGERRETTTTVHNGIKPKLRARILERATGRCELCGERDRPLHVGHLLSVADGLTNGLTSAELNSEANLCALCEQCNLGLGSTTVPLRLAIAILKARQVA